MEKENAIIEEISKCSARQEIEDVFDRFEISSDTEKIDILKKAMGSPMFFSSSEMSEEDEAHRIASIFLTGNWKTSKLYEKAGF